MLEWDDPRYKYLAGVEIWRAEADDLSAAIKIDVSPSTLYTDTPEVASLNKNYWYWVRAGSKSGVVGPYNATAGTVGHTANDPGYVLELLAGEITESELHAALSARIALVDNPVSGLVTQLAQAQAEVASIANQLGSLIIPAFDSGISYSVDDYVRFNSNVYRCIQNTAAPSPDPTDTDLLPARTQYQ